MKKAYFIFLFCLIQSKIILAIDLNLNKQKWIGTWSTALQLVETGNNPPPPGLANNTIRQIVRVSIGGESIRLKLSNEFSTNQVILKEVHIALSLGNGIIDSLSSKQLLFNGNKEFTINAGGTVTSDPVQFSLTKLTDVAITIYFGNTSADITGHPGSRTTSYILTGNQIDKIDFSEAVKTDHWYVINTIDVLTSDTTYAVAILGNSITDGRGSGTNKQNRWPDELAKRLQNNSSTNQVAVLNSGIGGNCVLGNCLGPSAISRFERDILNQSGIKWVIIFEGINDIGNAWNTDVGDRLIEAYKGMINAAHAKGIYAYGATILPMKGHSYFSESHESIRQKVNSWIRYGGLFDDVIDLDLALRNPLDTLSLLPEADTGDHLHPNENGHRMIADAVDLSLFLKKDSLNYSSKNETHYYEIECGKVGLNWNVVNDFQSSNEKYVTVKNGMQSLNSAPIDSLSIIEIPFNIDSTGTFSVYVRVNCATYDDDSFWLSFDNSDFQLQNGLVTSGWEWKKINDFNLVTDEHILKIAFREDGAKLDKVCIKNSFYPPSGLGEQAENLCELTNIFNSKQKTFGFKLYQNFPNPFNPFTNINYSVPTKTFVTIKVYDVLGNEVANLVNETKNAGSYNVAFDGNYLSSGVYLYQLKSEKFSETKKLILIK
ncbi:MAG: T9SS type A sorting domain-containing protein [Ignavibacteriae bacterium]|nr:T9SS type A sorting domain-containing protein [Ignavibacteriota bacterium]